MNWMADILTMLGEHFPLMLILSVEVIAAVALAVAAIGRRSKISLIRFLHFWGSNQRSDGTRRKRISSSHGSMEWSQEDIAG